MSVQLLRNKIIKLPSSPGVYLFKNDKGSILYVGKAKVLRNRVRSYFQGRHELVPRIAHLVQHIADVDVVLTNSEAEALLLESNFIKQYKPKYNVRLRDDKEYFFIAVAWANEIPSLSVTHQPTEKHTQYLGPFTSGRRLQRLLSFVKRIFPYCANKKVGKRACFYYHLGRCPGVCIGKFPLKQYRRNMQAVVAYINGNWKDALKRLRASMKAYSRTQEYEKAARIRDHIAAIENMQEGERLTLIRSVRKIAQDVISMYRASGYASVNLFRLRDGRLLEQERFLLDHARDVPDEKVLSDFLVRYYTEASNMPRELVLPQQIEQEETLIAAVAKEKGTRLRLIVPARGRFRKLIQMGQENAKLHLEKSIRQESALTSLARALSLRKAPRRIECYDISNIQGTSPTGSMVVFEEGKPKKSDYRKFHIRSKTTPDDFAMMREMLLRRFARRNAGSTQESWPLPDLIVVDGGRGQLNVALRVLSEYDLSIPAVGLAKRFEEIFLPARKNSLRLPHDSDALHMLQALRDEAHRFAITFHRKTRSKRLFGR